MKLPLKTISLFLLMFSLAGCSSESRISILHKCTVLGDESIAYARANYVKLFYYFNAEKFNAPYQQVKDFDHVTHRNVINTYSMAVRKLKAKDPVTESLLFACKSLATFSKNFVDQSYPRAIAHESTDDPLSDKFFTQINQIVKFDDSIGVFDKNSPSFNQHVINYQKATKQYRAKFKDELSTD
ncbi:MAG: hypothetical protein KAI17_25650 [Thiotrichaceae bacterium]|nr:hypothetical protein [Thiotrichaceae bacterium]